MTSDRGQRRGPSRSSEGAQPPRLPRQVEADPRGPALVQGLVAKRQLLWPGGSLHASAAQLSPELIRVLRSAWSASRLTRGLESATMALAAEQKGQQIADERSSAGGGESRGRRVSRLVILSNDGSERFYRHVESLLRQHDPRLLAVRLEVTAEQLGEAILGPETLARLLLISHRQAVADSLFSLAVQWGGTSPNPTSPAHDSR